jgi:broad-specificity NMP kinase
MTKVLVTGMSGTGKSTAVRLLGERGHHVVDTDTDQWSQWISLPDGSADWIWREDAVAGLLAGHGGGHLFVAGCKTNQGKFYAQFDHVALLSAPADVLLARIAARDNNPYGKRPGERALILRYLNEVEPRLRVEDLA